MPACTILMFNQWTQPNSVIPQPDNPQSFNRFSYVLNNPIDTIDPSGNDPWGCLTQACITREQNDYKSSSGSSNGFDPTLDGGFATSPTPGGGGDSKKGGSGGSSGQPSLQSNRVLSEGEIEMSSWFWLNTDVEKTSYAYKAEENYTDFAPNPNIDIWTLSRVAKGVTVASNVAGLVEDQQDVIAGVSLPRQVVGVQLNWQNTETGIYLTNVILDNHSSQTVGVINIKIGSQLIQGSGNTLGGRGTITEPINHGIASWNTLIQLNIAASGSFLHPVVIIPGGTIPGVGCATVPYTLTP